MRPFLSTPKDGCITGCEAIPAKVGVGAKPKAEMLGKSTKVGFI
jgi:hypothetical protein